MVLNKDINIRTLKVEEAAKMDEFLAKYMYSDEPLARTVSPEDRPVPGKGFATAFAPQLLSKVAEDDNGLIMGVCLNDTFPQPLPNIYSFSDSDEKFQDLFDYLQNESRVMEVASDAMELRMLVVDPTARKRGIGSRLVDESVEAAREAGFSWVKMYCTSEYSSRMIAKKGWTLLYSRSYKDLRDNAVKDLPVPAEPHTFVNLYIKATRD